jgi:N-acetyl-gamma-glutamylphosphate reductase
MKELVTFYTTCIRPITEYVLSFFKMKDIYRPIALTSQILRVSSGCFLTISVRVQQPHTAQKLTILIQNYYNVLQNLLCLQKLYYMHGLLICPPDASSPAL